MASKSVKKRPNGKWRARYRDHTGKEHAKHFDTRGEGQTWLDQQTAALITGQYVDPKNAKMRFRQYAELWQVAQMHRTGTQRRVDSALRCHIYPAFGDRQIGSIRKSDVQTWVTAMVRDGAAASSVRGRYVWFSAIMSDAVEDRIIPQTPCVGIDLPEIVKGISNLLTTEQVQRIEEKMDDRWKAIVWLMAGTGLRVGEATGLCVEQIDFLRRTLVVDRQLSDENPAALVDPKPGRKGSLPRVIPVPQTVIVALSAHIAKYGTGPDGVVFQGSQGGYFNRDQYGHRMRKAFKEAGVPDWASGHDLRHYYASLLIAHGEDVKVVQERLGHASATMTLDTYSKLWPGREDSTRDAIDSVLGSPADSLRTDDQTGS